jgi:hypothetical protein
MATINEKGEVVPEAPDSRPRTYTKQLIPVKTYYSEQELIEVIKRAQKRGFSVLVPKTGEKPSTTGLSDYFRTIEAESAKFEQFQRSEAKKIVETMETYSITTEMLLQARLKQ